MLKSAEISADVECDRAGEPIANTQAPEDIGNGGGFTRAVGRRVLR